MLRETERARHLDRVRAWNATGTRYSRHALAHELFVEEVRRRPDAVALSPEEGPDITYAGLLRRVESVAGTLVSRGVGVGDAVAVALERSVEGYVAILGTLRAGARYVPVDPSFPSARIETILADVGSRTVIASSRWRHELRRDVRVLHIAEMIGDVPAPDMPRMNATDVAYVMYTSGSTGKPKGVVIPHRGIVRLVQDRNLVGFRPQDTVCATVNLTFDLSVLELFGTLLNGARLVVPARETVLSAEALESVLIRERVSVMWLGAALFHQMAARRPGMFRTLRCLIAGGDALSPAAVRAVLAHGRPGLLVDGYGPTENSVLCTAHVIDELSAEAESVPIGRPISNSTAYVVRADGAVADVGEEGELWVGGDGVALGYQNLPELTAERFVPDRFADGGEGRLYRTGDMARWRADGVIEFLGRRDRQVKLSGFRVELQEIELVLAAHPQVRDAVVATLDRDGHDKYLCGWVTADRGVDTRALPMTLRRYLRDRLPVFMVPHEIRIVDAMPVNASGKVDRAALLVAVHSDGETAIDHDPPHDGTESMVATVWRQVLGVPVVHRADDFFELGGQSLQAAQVAAAVSGLADISAERAGAMIRTLLANPNLTRFAEQVDAVRDPSSTPEHVLSATDFRREADLPAALRFDAPPVENMRDPQRLLLTGATGFQGVFLLDRLVAAGVPEVWCVVRAQDATHARRRLAGRMRRYGLDYEKVRAHVVIVVGDMSKPRLGLDPDAFDQLAVSVDAIIHNGSLINFAYPYTTLSSTNVDGVRTLLRLATTHRLKPLHHVSTMIVLAGFGTADMRYVMEDQPLDFPERISLGYPESKWVAEQLVRNAAQRGLPVSIYRPYEITGTRDRGIWNTDTLMCAWFRTIAETGVAPDVELPLDFVPVDYTAEAIVHILRTQRPDGRVYNLTNPHDARLGLLVDRLRYMGYPVRKVPYTTWVGHVTALTRRDPHHPMTAFMPMFNDGAADTSITVKEMYFAETFPQFSRTNTERATRDAGLHLPPVDAALIDNYLRYFVESGFLAPPPSLAIPVLPPSDDTAISPGERTAKLVKIPQPIGSAHLRANPLYRVASADELTPEQLRRLVAGELRVQPAKAAAFTLLANRFEGTAAGALFGKAAETITSTRPTLRAATNAWGMTGHEPIPPGADVFVEVVTWLGHNACQGAAAAVLRNAMMLWCAICAELRCALQRHALTVPAPFDQYLDGQCQAPRPMLRSCADVLTTAIDHGEDTAAISFATRRVDSALHAYCASVVHG